MWLSNTATSLVMLPIGLSVAGLLQSETVTRREDADFDAALLLAIAYGASIGGMATLIGTPPNALLAAFLSESHDHDIGFAQWMAFGLPLAALMLGAAWVVLTRLAFRVPHAPLPGARDIVAREAAKLGPMTGPEKRVATVFAIVALLWLLRPQLEPWLPGGAQLGDPGIALLGALVLFALPSGRAPGERLLHWAATTRLPWGVLILFGGGLSLAGAISDSGLAAWIAGEMRVLGNWPLAGLVAAVSATVVMLTELTSNTATAATFLPLLAELATALGHDPLVLAAPAAVAASCAFMLPVATPPNAIVYGSGRISMPQMARAGIWLNVLSTLLATTAALLLVPLVFG
jgi:sodium-dependent dicarboxylate transporter 2/3/5